MSHHDRRIGADLFVVIVEQRQETCVVVGVAGEDRGRAPAGCGVQLQHRGGQVRRGVSLERHHGPGLSCELPGLPWAVEGRLEVGGESCGIAGQSSDEQALGRVRVVDVEVLVRHQLVRGIQRGLWVVVHQGADGFGGADADGEYGVGGETEDEGSEFAQVAGVVEEEGRARDGCLAPGGVQTCGQQIGAGSFSVQVADVPLGTGGRRVIREEGELGGGEAVGRGLERTAHRGGCFFAEGPVGVEDQILPCLAVPQVGCGSFHDRT
ncbi:hypothetical protein [Streptomyces cinereoruber]|uniref:hypothetical protein n=1 Tax=Streptomyces cinereoruber TaxID=67260 RepID=UPI00362AFD89